MYPLDFALKTGNVHIVEHLIGAGASPVQNRGGLKALASFAVRHRSKSLLSRVFKTLEDEDTDEWRMEWGEALAIAIAQRDQSFVSLLLQKGANPNMVYEGLLPLTRAANIGDKVICLTLLQHGAYLDYNQTATSLGQAVTPLSCAIQNGLYNAILVLIELGCSVDTVVDWSFPATGHGRSLASGSSLLHLAVWKRKLIIAKALVNAGCCLNPQNSEWMTPLHIAACDPNSIEMLKFLMSLPISVEVPEVPAVLNATLKHGKKNFNKGPKKGFGRGFNRSFSAEFTHSQPAVATSKGFYTVFSRACSLDTTQNSSFMSRTNQRANLMKTLFAKLPDDKIAINAQDKDGRTPLMLALEEKNIDAVSLLIEHGANLEVKDNYNWTALLYAAKSGHESLVLSLLQAGCSVDGVPAKHQSTALQVSWKLICR